MYSTWYSVSCLWKPTSIPFKSRTAVGGGALESVKMAMSPLTLVFACPLGDDDVPYDDSVRINLENQALLEEWLEQPLHWRGELLASTMIIDRQNGKD